MPASRKPTTYSPLPITSQSGMTIIELIVTFTIVSLIGIATLIVINPAEQKRKAEDTKLKDAAVEYVTAQRRYKNRYGCYTWYEDDLNHLGTCTYIPHVNNEDPKELQGGGSNQQPKIALHKLPADSHKFLQISKLVKQSFVDKIDSQYKNLRIYEDGAGDIHIPLNFSSQSYTAEKNCNRACTVCDGTREDRYCIPDSLE